MCTEIVYFECSVIFSMISIYTFSCALSKCSKRNSMCKISACKSALRMIELNLLLICQCFIKFTLFIQGINFFCTVEIPQRASKTFYTNNASRDIWWSFLWTSCCWLNRNKAVSEMPADSLFFSLFLMTMIIWKKKSLLAAILPPYRIQITLCTLGGNAALTQTVIGMLLMTWKKMTHSSSKHQQTRHRSGDLCISNTIRVGVGKRYFALAHWCIGFSCESREDFTQFF